MVVTALICLALLLYVYFVYMKPSRAKLPAGPAGIPFLGNTFQFPKERFVLTMADLGRKYGDAYTVQILRTKHVVLNSFDLIKEALGSHDYAVTFSGREPTFTGTYMFQKSVILSTYSEEWAAYRKLIMRGLKTYGSNMADVEDLVQGEIQHLLDRIQNEAGTSVDPLKFVSGYITSVISMLVTGRHLKHDDPELKKLASTMDQLDAFTSMETLQLMTAFPWLRHIPIGCGNLYKQVKGNLAEIQKNIIEGRKKLAEDTDRRSCFLDYMQEEKNKGHVTDKHVSDVMIDMLGAGTATSRATLYSILLVLTANPDIQRRIQEEIDEVVGRSRLPCSGDKNSLPYTQAVVFEALRLYPSIPIPFPHRTLQEVQIREYTLPKDTSVMYNIWQVLHDEKFWKDPFVFNPSRFLDDTGNLLPPENENRQRTITFGLGRRMCIGETLARLRIFLALSAILQRFTLKSDPDHPLPDTDPRTFSAKALLMAPNYNMIFEPRN